jgi:hypothetical protein
LQCGEQLQHLWQIEAADVEHDSDASLGLDRGLQ